MQCPVSHIGHLMYLRVAQRHPADSSTYKSSIVPLDGNLEAAFQLFIYLSFCVFYWKEQVYRITLRPKTSKR